MTLQTITPAERCSFKEFLFQNSHNRLILYLITAAIIIQFAIFKYLYPFANYIHGDSFSYLNAAYNNLSINTYPIGYSKFLRLISVFAKPDYILTALQYLSIQLSILFFLYTTFYFYNPIKTVQIILLCFMVLNPLFLHLANMVSSDGLFLALSSAWFALLIWITHQPTKKIIIYHAVILFLAFTVRYNALLYPFISTLVLCISPLSLLAKIKGILLYSVLCLAFIGFTTYQYKKLTGNWQYSPFSGWQMANNAMYAYRYVQEKDRKPVPSKFKELDKMIRQYFDSTHDTKKFPVESYMASSFYMWSPGLPLMKYRNDLFKKAKDSISGELKKWASIGPFYKDYGWFIIRQHPLPFIKYFLWPNSNKYYAPPVEFLEVYNSGKKNVMDVAQIWFGYNNQNIRTRTDGKVSILNFYPILSGVLNMVIFLSFFCYLLLKGWRYDRTFSKAIFLGGTMWLTNAIFTIFASSAALRFQSFPIILTITWVGLLIAWMMGLSQSLKTEHDSLEPQSKQEVSKSNLELIA